MLAPQRGLFAIGQNQNRENIDVQSIAKVFILVIPAPYQVRGKLQQESSFFWIPGRVSLARNDNPTFPKMSNARSPPAEPGVYLTAVTGYGRPKQTIA